MIALVLWVLGYTPQNPSETLVSPGLLDVEIVTVCRLGRVQGNNPMRKFLIAGVAATAFCGAPTELASLPMAISQRY
jgi:hypothetical protein